MAERNTPVLTRDELIWVRAITDLGCIVYRLNDIYSPPDIHHILRSGKKQTNLETIPLCFIHHRSGLNNEVAVSRHPHKREFERRYGTENELFKQCKVQSGK